MTATKVCVWVFYWGISIIIFNVKICALFPNVRFSDIDIHTHVFIDHCEGLSKSLVMSCFCLAASPCLAYPCLNGGTCKEASNNTYTCQCAEGFEGTNCEVEVVEPETPPDGGLGTACWNICLTLSGNKWKKSCIIPSLMHYVKIRLYWSPKWKKSCCNIVISKKWKKKWKKRSNQQC